MTIRVGMETLLGRLTEKTNPGSEFSPDQLQDILDRNFAYFKYAMLTPDITRTNADTYPTAIYVDYYIPKDLGLDFEVPVLGEINTSFFLESYIFEPIVWGTGETQAQYNETLRRISFNQDQHGKYYFLSGNAYDLNAAAAEVWLIKWSAREKYINIKTDNHSLDLSESRDFCYKQYQYYASLSNKNIGTHFARVDQGVGYQRNPMNLSRKPY